MLNKGLADRSQGGQGPGDVELAGGEISSLDRPQRKDFAATVFPTTPPGEMHRCCLSRDQSATDGSCDERPPREAKDISVLTGWFSSVAEVMQWAGPRLLWPLDGGQLAQFLRPIGLERDEWSAWSVCTADDVVGHFQLRFDPMCRQVTLGRVAIAPSRRGHGLAGPMMQLALAKAFSIPSAHRVELRVYDFNEAAI